MTVGTRVEIMVGSHVGEVVKVGQIIEPYVGCADALYLVRLANGRENMYRANEIRKATEAKPWNTPI